MLENWKVFEIRDVFAACGQINFGSYDVESLPQSERIDVELYQAHIPTLLCLIVGGSYCTF